MTVESTFPKGIALLEIEAIQLANLFAASPSTDQFHIARSVLSLEFRDEDLDALDALDIYAVPRGRQREVFVLAAFQAILGRKPSAEELTRYRELLTSGNGYHAAMRELEKLRDDAIQELNDRRAESIGLTLSDLDRWAGAKQRWWK